MHANKATHDPDSRAGNSGPIRTERHRGTHRVLILGGGFGGLLATKALRRAPVEVTLVDKRNFHLFQPLLYQVATGSLAPGQVAAPLRGILRHQKNVSVLLGEAVDVDPAGGSVLLADGDRIEYDSLIVATGSQSSYSGYDQWRQWAPSLKSMEEATAIRHKILYAFEAAERAKTSDERRAWLTFTVVGAGATGVELAGAVAEIATRTLRDEFRSIRPEQAQIFLLNRSSRVLASYPERLSEDAERALTRLGVRVRNETRVMDIDGEGVRFQLPDGTESRIATRTVLWAGGVMPSDFTRTLASRIGAVLEGAGRIRVNADLTAPGYENIYLAGDIALAHGLDGAPLPGVCQVAMQQGVYAARTIVGRLNGRSPSKPFHYFNKGDMAVIGRGAAVANIFGLQLSGSRAWLIWLFVHLMYLVNFQNRVLVFVQWGFQYLTFSRAQRLITGNRTCPTQTDDF
ncbi:MAG TPA: NAD(P)/FAD-dependent oxidoreductase [Bryobacteraceae bacterium]|nr:NAD(P)/FAD-dependent oxidoreductase [Bryobacteraceae bacterium]